MRGDVHVQLQPRQFVADGAHHRRRLRGRRRHRGGGEHPPPHRGWRFAVRGRAPGLARDRLHRAVDQPVAGGGVHSAPAHGRHHRAHVPRIRAHRHGLDRGVGARLAHARADAVLALHASRTGTPRPRLPRHRGRLQCAAVALQAHARRGAPPPGDHAGGVLRHDGADRGHDPSDSQGLLPDPGHRRHPGLCRNRPGCAARADDAHLARVRRGAAARSGRLRLRLVHRQHRRRQHRQHRAFLHRAQAARRARAHLLANHRPAAAAARQSSRRDAVPAADPGHHHGRPHCPRQFSIHAAGLQRRRAQRMVG